MYISPKKLKWRYKNDQHAQSVCFIRIGKTNKIFLIDKQTEQKNIMSPEWNKKIFVKLNSFKNDR